jgi:beta-glucosidase
MKKIIIALWSVVLLSGCIKTPEIIDENPMDQSTCALYDGGCYEQALELLQTLTLEEKVGQMIQAEQSAISPEEVQMYNIGSVLSGGGSHPSHWTDSSDVWYEHVTSYVEASRSSSSEIPLLYGVDAVHGHHNVYGMTIFPHHINLGAMNDANLVYELSKATAEQMKTTGILWNFAPSVALVTNTNWGRTYESYGGVGSIHENLVQAAIKGYLDEGVMPTAKHFFADGATNGMDQGNAILNEEDILNQLRPYELAIEAEVPIVMASYNSVNGIKMHGNAYYLTDVLKNDMQFPGFIVSDWNAIEQLEGDLYLQIIQSINAGIDMLMQPFNWLEVYEFILLAVNNAHISMSRIDDAVLRILQVKLSAGIFETQPRVEYTDTMKLIHQQRAREVVSKSAVLLKQSEDNWYLNAQSKVYLTGPGHDHIGLMSGGWTTYWQGNLEANFGVGMSLNDTLMARGVLSSYDDADTVVVVLSEMPYAEMYGDQVNPTLTTGNAHPENQMGIALAKKAKEEGKKVIVVIFSGRPLIIDDIIEFSDSIVAAFLPGSEGGPGLTDLLFHEVVFQAKTPFPWRDQFGQVRYPIGYGLQ